MKRQPLLFRRVIKPYFILITIIVSIANIAVYFATVERVKTGAVEAAHQLAENTAMLTDTYINDLEALAAQVNHQQKITNKFYELNETNDSGANHFSRDILGGIDLSSALNALLAGRTADYNILIYNKNGDFISSHNYMINEKEINEYITDTGYEKIFKRLNENDGFIIESPSENKWTNSRERYITYITFLQNEYSDAPCGIIEVRASAAKLDSILHTDNNEKQILISDRSNGEIIYPLDFNNEKQNSYITAPLEAVYWEAAIPYDNTAPAGLMRQLILLFVLLYVVLIAVTLIITAMIGRYVSRPILELSDRVRKISSTDGRLQPVDEAFDEIKNLEDSFNSMLERVNNSIKKEKEAYSLALQAQMNPHFLYNSLSVIGAAGMEANAENVYDMCIELSDMLRYVAAYEKVTVPLRDEIAHTKNYLSLMKSRYEELFEYSIKVDKKLLNMPVPKLFIQPLAENCFMHGFKKIEPPWRIDITMSGSRDRWTLVIKDNGGGITDERIEEIKTDIKNALSEMSVGGIGGLGIINTIVRLKITHNNHISYKIENDNGTRIKIISGGEENV